MVLTGPEVIKAVTNEVVGHEDLGGAELHASVSGTVHLVSRTEKQALELVRTVLTYLPANNTSEPPAVTSPDRSSLLDRSLNDIVPSDPMEPYSMHAVLEAITDGSTFLELMPSWARNAIIGLARLGGRSVGIVANEPAVIAGVMDINSADKIARFVRFCDAFHLPIVTFVDSPGFLPGVTQEYGGVIRHGAKVLYAYAEASVPKVSVVTRKAYGGAYIVMSSKYLGSDVNFAWPSAEIAVMGAEGAVNILFREKLAASGNVTAVREELTEEYRRKFSSPYTAAALGTVDDVIEPATTRSRVIAALEALQDKQLPHPPRKHGNMPV